MKLSEQIAAMPTDKKVKLISKIIGLVVKDIKTMNLAYPTERFEKAGVFFAGQADELERAIQVYTQQQMMTKEPEEDLFEDQDPFLGAFTEPMPQEGYKNPHMQSYANKGSFKGKL